MNKLQIVVIILQSAASILNYYSGQYVYAILNGVIAGLALGLFISTKTENQ
jgi:hypothetical protein